MAPSDSLRERYDSLWTTSLPAIRNGDIEIDPLLAARTFDPRRGLTLLARPDPPVIERIADFLNQLRLIEPDQYYYPSAQLHVTILSLFTATEHHEQFDNALNSYRDAVETALSGIQPFVFEFTGITASRAAVMVQGFPQSGEVETLRARLRLELQNRGLIDGLDTRYRLITAHVTAMRFRQSLFDCRKLAEKLEEFRTHPFGSSRITKLSLVKNDWYMSPESLELLTSYQLS